MTRYPDWRVRLNDYLEAFQPSEEVNCALFAAGAVVAMTGQDPLRDLGHGSPDEIHERIKQKGFATPRDQLKALFEEVHPNLAMIGDIALMKGRTTTLGVVIGADIKVLRPDGTVGIIPIKSAKAVFRP